MTVLADELTARRNKHPNHIAHCTVTITAPCPACGADAKWRGGRVELGGATAWTVHCECTP